MKRRLELLEVPGLPLVKQDDCLGQLIVEGCQRASIDIQHGDVFVVAQKVVSKSEGATIQLDTVVPTDEAVRLSHVTGRDARLCQIYLDESIEVIEVKGTRVITRHRLGHICSSAGVDRGNVPEGTVSLLPRDPDASARRIRTDIEHLTGATVAVIINDSFGRPGRRGSVGISIGAAGIKYLKARPEADLYDRVSTRQIALVDELAAAASILMGQGGLSCPVVLVRGVDYDSSENPLITDILEP